LRTYIGNNQYFIPHDGQRYHQGEAIATGFVESTVHEVVSKRFWKKPHSTELRGEVCHRSAKASGGEDLQVEKPVSCWDCASFHFHATVAGMLGPTLIRDEVV
jgi:hypothetical protein